MNARCSLGPLRLADAWHDYDDWWQIPIDDDAKTLEFAARYGVQKLPTAHLLVTSKELRELRKRGRGARKP